MLDFTFLTESEIKKLEILKQYGRKCAATDFSILLGVGLAEGVYTSEGDSIENTACWWWTKNKYKSSSTTIVNEFGDFAYSRPNKRAGGGRPAIPYSLIEKNSTILTAFNDISIVEYGEYPQSVVVEPFANLLEREYNRGKVLNTGRYYTTDSALFNNYVANFSAINHLEYYYNGFKYIRVVGDLNGSCETLSDGRKVVDGNIYWIRVEPIEWLVDTKADIALSKKALFAGVQFDHKDEYDGDFSKTDIKKFMDNHFSKDIVAGLDYSKFNIEKKDEKFKRENPYAFDFDEVSEEDIIHGALESDVAVFLHGRSSEGKSARVKQFDPDPEIIYLRNATPDSLNGKCVYNAETGEMIDVPPTWFKKLKKKCEDEPDKLHVLFFDEITNALPSIQGMAFNIILDKEVNGVWKLPKNARIVAAGNDLNDSLAANTMAEPLFNRFAHVYINTTVDKWLMWASTPKKNYERLDYKRINNTLKIHPAIYAYIASKSFRGEDVLRTPYNGETPNADPRKWEMASKVLYTTNNPEMLRSLIGEELTSDFVYFVKQRVITVNDVINGNYTDMDLEMNVSEKFATAVNLSSVDENNLSIIRDFVLKLGPEICATFDILWCHGDERRLERIAELKLAETNGGLKK